MLVVRLVIIIIVIYYFYVIIIIVPIDIAIICLLFIMVA